MTVDNTLTQGDTSEPVLGVHSRLGDWLDHAVGGPLLVAALFPEGGDPGQLDMIRGLSMRRLVATSQGALTQEAATQLVLTVSGRVLEDDDFDEPSQAGLTFEELVAVHPHLAPIGVADVRIEGPHGPVDAREYLPTGRPAAGFVWIHGGGFVGGDLDMADSHWVALELAARGIHVLSVDYRKTVGGVTYPVPADDVLAAWQWAGGYLGDAGALPLHVGGASAGAALAAALTVRLGDGAGPVPASVVLAYPIVHPALPTVDDSVDWYVGFTPEAVHHMNLSYAGHLDVLDDPHAFAGVADLHEFPPTFILNSEHDALRASGELFARQLTDSGVETRMMFEPHTIHGHLSDPKSEAAQASVARIADWILHRG